MAPHVSDYSSNVFLNCPFDEEYRELREALVFVVYDCGFRPRCALEENDCGDIRFDKLTRLISECKFGVHDISRTELDEVNSLPRFNMPFELGLFIGAKRFGTKHQKMKNCLILDCEQYRYQKFLSDISGNDIRSHDNDVEKLISQVRNWLSAATKRKSIPGGREIRRRFHKFQAELPKMCEQLPIEIDELTYRDYSHFVSEWLRQTT